MCYPDGNKSGANLEDVAMKPQPDLSPASTTSSNSGTLSFARACTVIMHEVWFMEPLNGTSSTGVYT